MQPHWCLSEPDLAVQQGLATATGLPLLLCRLLVNRGITDEAAARAFLDPSLHDLPHPSLLHGMGSAVQRLLTALRHGEPIAIYGDYDVDGVTGTALLVTFFRQLGLQVPYYIPDRFREGYGLHAEALHRLAGDGVRLLVTVDCGVSAAAEIALAHRLGIDIIVTDHHQAPPDLPPASAMLNPHQPACRYPNKNLSGVGVVFKLLMALRAALREARLFPDPLPNLKRHLDLVTLGTIADVVPLQGENRILVFHGLQELARTHKPGLQALRRLSKREGQPASVSEVGFQLAPRLNASGRLGSAMQSVALLTTPDEEEAMRLAHHIEAVNGQRRALQQTMEADVHTRLAQQYDGDLPAAIIMGDPSWHLGVVGIVAARIAETYHRPTFLLRLDGETARGSGRSIPHFNLYRGLQHCARWLRQFGGHPYAAGLTLATAHLPSLQEDFLQYARDHLRPGDLRPTLHLDAEVTLAEMQPELVAQMAGLAPHGNDNPTPLLYARGVVLSAWRPVGQDGQHARFRLTQEGMSLEAVAFRVAKPVAAWREAASLDVAFTPVIQTWRQRGAVELHVRAMRAHGQPP